MQYNLIAVNFGVGFLLKNRIWINFKKKKELSANKVRSWPFTA